MQNEFDPIDIVALVLLPTAAGMVLNVWTLALDVFGGYDFAEPLWSIGGIGISVALIATVAAIAWIVATNEIDGSNYEDWEYGAIAFALIATPMYAAVPSFASLVDSYDVVALVLWFGIAGVSVYLSWTE